MKALKLSEDLKPLSEVKAKTGEVIRQVEETGRPVVVTRHGRGVAVLMSVANYERLQRYEAKAELMASIRDAERDIEEGRFYTTEEVMAHLQTRLDELGAE